MIGGYVDKISAMRVMDVPVGKGFIYTLAMGVSDGLIGAFDNLLKKWKVSTKEHPVPAILPALGAALLVRKIRPVKNFLGDGLAEALSIASVRSGIDQTIEIEGLPLSAWVQNKLTKLTGPSALPGGGPGVSVEAPFLAAPMASDENLGAAQEYLTSVERKIRAIAQK